jgi:hypothetical protein
MKYWKSLFKYLLLCKEICSDVKRNFSFQSCTSRSSPATFPQAQVKARNSKIRELLGYFNRRIMDDSQIMLLKLENLEHIMLKDMDYFCTYIW